VEKVVDHLTWCSVALVPPWGKKSAPFLFFQVLTATPVWLFWADFGGHCAEVH